MIKHAAILHNGIIYKGKRHREIIDDAKTDISKGSEGFLTSDGLFVDREQAAKIAYTTGQIKKKKSKLISEDLW